MSPRVFQHQDLIDNAQKLGFEPTAHTTDTTRLYVNNITGKQVALPLDSGPIPEWTIDFYMSHLTNCYKDAVIPDSTKDFRIIEGGKKLNG